MTKTGNFEIFFILISELNTTTSEYFALIFIMNELQKWTL